MSGNPIVQIPISSSLLVQNYTEDAIPPELDSFDINLNTDMILLTFSETIKPESLNITFITFTNRYSNYTSYYTLTGGNQSYVDIRFLNITLNKEDSDEIRRLSDLLTTPDDSFIVLLNGTITDMNGNPITSTIKQVRVFNEDKVRPSLLSYDLDMNR